MTLNILWNSDKILGTSGYSRVTFEVCTRLAKIGFNVAHIPMARANRMGTWNFQGVLILPSGQDSFNEDVIAERYATYKADMLITLKDLWCLQQTGKWALNLTPYVPIDHSPVSPLIVSRLQTAFKVITPSRHGQRELRQAGITAHYIPHGVNTEVYRPLEDKAECKRLWFIKDPDDFTVLIVARNQVRKMIPRMLRIYKRFLQLNPDVKSHMLLWTAVQPPAQEEFEGAVGMGVSDVGVNLIPEITGLGLGEKVLWPDAKLVREGLPDWTGKEGYDMVKLYNAADVLLGLTGGEGFFLPGIEAEACGVPIVVTEYASAPEVCGSGLTVPPSDYDILSSPGTRFALADIDRGAEALTKIMNADPQKLAKKAREFALRYEWNVIMERYWKPFLDQSITELFPKVTATGVSAWA